jgi:hypothetical protein
MEKQDTEMARRGRLGIVRIPPPEDSQGGEQKRFLWRGHDKEPDGITFESTEDLDWAVRQLKSPVRPGSPAQFFEHQLVILEDLGKEWVKKVAELFQVPLEVFAYHEVSPGDYATGRARLPLGERPEQHFFLPYRETLPWKIDEQLTSREYCNSMILQARLITLAMEDDGYRLSCGSVRLVDQRTSSENRDRENATCEAAVSYWATFESPEPKHSGAWTGTTVSLLPLTLGRSIAERTRHANENSAEGLILVDPRPAKDNPIIRALHDKKGDIDSRLPNTSQRPKRVESTFSSVPGLPALQVNKSYGPNYRDRLVLLRGCAETGDWQHENELTSSTFAAQPHLSMFEELIIRQPPTASFHPVCSTKTVRRLVLAKMSLIVDCFVQRAFVLTYLAMQNITSITQFDFTKLDNNAWQDEWRAEFFSNLWELREDIEMLGSEMSRTQRLVKVLAVLSSDELPNSRRLRDGVQRDQDFEDIDQWEELEATREYSAQLLQRTTDSYVQAAAAEGAKFANIQAVR